MEQLAYPILSLSLRNMEWVFECAVSGWENR